MISNGRIDRRIGPQSLVEKIKENSSFPICLASASVILFIFVTFVEIWFGSSPRIAIVTGHVAFIVFTVFMTIISLYFRGWNWIEFFISIFLTASIFITSLFFIMPLLITYISTFATISPDYTTIIPTAP